MKLNNQKLMSSLAAGILVQLGVAAKNSSEQVPELGPQIGNLGKILFVCGWLLTAYSIAGANLNQKALLAYGGAVGVVAVVMQMKKLMTEQKPLPKLLPALFVAAWLAVAYSIAGTNVMNKRGVLAYGAVACVVVSMTVMLPWQRKKCVVDGLGMNLFSMAWVMLSAANALQQ